MTPGAELGSVALAAHLDPPVVDVPCYSSLSSALLISKHMHHSRAVMMHAYGNPQRSTAPQLSILFYKLYSLLSHVRHRRTSALLGALSELGNGTLSARTPQY